MNLNFRTLKPISLAVILFVVITLKDLLTEMVGGKIGDYLHDNFGIKTTTLVYSLIGILVISLLYAIYEVFKNPSETKEIKTITEDIEPDVKRFYDSLKERYRKRYESKLDGRFEITLEVSENWDGGDAKDFKGEYEGKGQIGEAFEYINSSFEKQGRLLIVGNPGVGKTVLLLKLALKLLEKADIEKKEAFPVIFNLASWSNEYEKFDDWLISVLNSGEGLSKDFAEKLLQEERLVFLLDGLDELARNEDKKISAEIRAQCLQSLNEYLDRGKKAVICCRVVEFKQMHKLTGKDAPVLAKVKINDLTEAEVLNTLMKLESDKTDKTASANLLIVLNKNENKELLKVLSTPFYFTTALEVFDKQIFEESNLPKEAKDLEDYLRRKFVEKKLNKTLNPNEFYKEKTKKWLKWLAELMERKQLSVFELADLQPSDLTKNKLYIWFNKLFNLFVMIDIQRNAGIKSFRKFDPNQIIPEDIISFNASKIFTGYYTEIDKFYLGFNLLSNILLGCLIGIGVSFFNKHGILYNVSLGISILLIYTFVRIFLDILENMKEVKKVAYLNIAYQRIKSGLLLQVLLVITLICFFLVIFFVIEGARTEIGNLYSIRGIIIFFLIDSSIYLSLDFGENEVSQLIEINKNLDIPSDIFFILELLKWITYIICMYVMIPALSRLLSTTLVRHFILRFYLYLEDSIPLNYATFLDYVAETRILEKDGGHWRFRHQNLQDYFAGLDEQAKISMSNDKSPVSKRKVG